MAVYIISRDGAGDGSGLIIKSSFNCILLHYNDVTELARLSHSLPLPLSLSVYCIQLVKEGVVYGLGMQRTLGDTRPSCTF